MAAEDGLCSPESRGPSLPSGFPGIVEAGFEKDAFFISCVGCVDELAGCDGGEVFDCLL